MSATTSAPSSISTTINNVMTQYPWSKYVLYGAIAVAAYFVIRYALNEF